MARCLPFLLVLGFNFGCMGAMGKVFKMKENFTCPPDVEGFFPDSLGCSQDFYYCNDGTTYAEKCPCGYEGAPPEDCTVFDPNISVCVNPENCVPLTTLPTTLPTTTTTTQATTTLRPFNCPYDGFFPVPQSCTSNYYVCVGGVALPQSCPENTIFDPVTYKCTPSEEASCLKPFECPNTEGFFPYSPDACSSMYYLCVNGNSIIQYCPQNSVFVPDTAICAPVGAEPPCTPGGTYTSSTTQLRTTTTSATSTTSTPSTLRPFTCQSDGFFPVPESCTNSYYLCIDGLAIPQSCPGDSIFDPVTYRCTASAEASCNQPFLCPTQAGTQVYPYSPEACTSLYYVCINGIAIVTFCPENGIFLQESSTCVPLGEQLPCKPGSSYQTTIQSSVLAQLQGYHYVK